jgi:hypothetical protein
MQTKSQMPCGTSLNHPPAVALWKSKVMDLIIARFNLFLSGSATECGNCLYRTQVVGTVLKRGQEQSCAKCE